MATTFVDTASSGLTTVVAAPSNPRQFVRVYGFYLTSNGVTTCYLASNSTQKIATIYAVGIANGGIIFPSNVEAGGLMDCNPGEALKLYNSAAVAVGLTVVYAIMG